MSPGALRRAAAERFAKARLDSPSLEAKLFILAATGWSETDFILKANDTLSKAHEDAIESLIKRRLGGEPLDHILGYRDFYGRRFDISKDVLSPRQETEGLVDAALAHLSGTKSPRVLDLGTGSGAVIISLLAERPDATGLATDISKAALTIARRNAVRLGVSGRLAIACGDWLEPVSGHFDMIVSNPPYITDAAMTALPGEVSGFDPDISLRGGADGLAAYQVITRSAADFLKPGGWLGFEIGYDQGISVSSILRDNFITNIRINQDLSGHDRVAFGQKPTENNC